MKQIKNVAKSKMAALGASAFVLMVVPFVTEAKSITEFLGTVKDWLDMLVPMLITLGIIAFFWGLAMYLFKEGEDKGKGLNIMMMGILAVFVMASLGGLVKMLQDTTDTGGSNTLKGPCVGGVGSGCGTGSRAPRANY